MTTTARDGGPVYPGNKAIQFGQDSGCNEGMSLRDYFALKATDAWSAAPVSTVTLNVGGERC
jgi:hypothetical protein